MALALTRTAIICAAALSAATAFTTPARALSQADVSACADVRSDERAVAAAEALDRYFSRMEPYGFGGSIHVEEAGCPVLDAAYGMADRHTARPNSIDTGFSIGSITKFLTAATIHSMAADGLIELDAPAARYLEEMPDDKRGITVRQLLQHRSGLETDYWDQNRDIPTQDAFVRMMLDRPLAAEPGTRFTYNNFGYLLLQLIVERVSGQTFEQALQDRVFDPSGATRIGMPGPDWSAEALAFYQDATARNWADQLGTQIANPLDLPPYLQPDGSGGVLATAADLARVFRFIESGDGPVSLQDFRQSVGTSGYGSGLWFADTADEEEIWHGGYDDTRGVLALLSYRPETDMTVVVLSNTHMGGLLDSTVLRRVIAMAAAGDAIPLPPEAGGNPVETLIVGRYANADGTELTIRSDGGGPVIRAADEPAVAALLLPGLQSPATQPVPAGIGQMMTALDLGDCDAFLALAMESVRFPAYCERAGAVWAQVNAAYGPLEELSLLHRAELVHEGRDETWWIVASRHASGVIPLRFVENADGDFYVSPIELPAALELTLVPVGNGRFASWNPYLGAPAYYRFDADSLMLDIATEAGPPMRFERQ